MAKQDFALAHNPLVNPPSVPNGAPAFDKIEPKHFMPALDWAIAQAEANIEAIKTNSDTPTFENTIEALEFATADLTRVQLVFDNLTLSHTNEDLEAIEEDFMAKITELSNNISLDDDIFARVKAVYDNKSALTLTTEQNTLLESSYKGFVRSGAELGATGKQRIREIDEELSKLTTKYGTNVKKDEGEYQRVIDDKADLDGVPERVIERYAHAATEAGMSGKYLVSMSPPPMEIVSYATDRALRQEMYEAMYSTGNGGAYDNNPIMIEIVKLRHEKAQLLGYQNHSDFVLSERMAGSQKTVEDFLEKNRKAYKPKAEQEIQAIKDFANDKDGLTDFMPWDYAYYSRQLKEETFQIDMEEVREYFELDAVVDGMFRHAEKLFGIEVTNVDGKYPVYDPDVSAYEIHDAKSGDLVGVFYTDYFAKPGQKKPGAWMNIFRNAGLDENGQMQVPIVINNMNLPKPVPGTPSLISIRDVETLFHEFGHGLHGLLGEGTYPSLTGTAVKWDFVELPSQVQENWATEQDVLNTYAFHHETGDVIPADMVQKIKDMSNFSSGYVGLRQTNLGLIDLAWHTTDPSDLTDANDLEEAVAKTSSVMPWTGHPMSPAFGHLFSDAIGYSSGYYSYKWAEVLDADVFEAFKEAGLYDEELGEQLRATIYSKGGTEAPDEIYRQMMGRDPDPDALFRREGIISDQDQGDAPQARQRPGGPTPKP